MIPLVRRAAGWAAFAAAVYLGLLGLLWLRQEWLIFRPSPLPAEHRFAFGPDVHETWVEVDGARLNALHLKLPAPRGVVFYLHGNAGNLQSWFVDPAPWRRAGLDLFMIDYRGYGKSSGRIESEAQLMADMRTAWRQIEPAYAGKLRVFFGRSLGTGIAAQLAAEVQPELTVMVSPYESLAAMAREHYPWVPGALLRYPMRSDLALPRLRGAVLLAHGGRDTLIGPEHSQRLQRLAPQAQLVVVPEAGHGDIHRHAAYRAALDAALAQALAALPAAR